MSKIVATAAIRGARKIAREAEEFLNNNRIDKDAFILVPKFRNGEVINTEKVKFSELLEAYHKHEVEAITDDEIIKAFPINDIIATKGALWFKNKLLKQ